MPLEISEIGIRLAVGDGASHTAAANAGAASPQQAEQHDPQVEEIVRQCVRRVLESLRMHEAR
jgi:hypothetical protein